MWVSRSPLNLIETKANLNKAQKNYFFVGESDTSRNNKYS